MEVAVSELRAHLRECLDRVKDGEQLVVTERGRPVARIVGTDAETLIERLERAGVIGKPRAARRIRSDEVARVRATGGPISDYVSGQRG